jgi:hypothetical protein
VSSCAADQNVCTELQLSTTASVLTLVFRRGSREQRSRCAQFLRREHNRELPADALVSESGGLGNHDSRHGTGAGLRTGMYHLLEYGAATGGPSCSTLQTFSVPGTFDAGGPPSLFVTVEPAGTATPEPSGLLPIGIGLVLLGVSRRIRASKFQPQSKLNFPRSTRPHGAGVQD